MFRFRHIVLFLSLVFSSFLKAESDSLLNFSPLTNTSSLEITGHNVICRGRYTELHAVGVSASQYRWTIPNTSQQFGNSILIHSASFPATDTVLVMVEALESGTVIATARQSVFITTRPSVIPVHDTICVNTEATVGMITTARHFHWSTGGTTDSINIYLDPMVTTTYTVQVSNYPIMEVGFSNDCYITDSATVFVREIPNFYIIGDTIGCVGDSITLTVVNGFDIIWWNGETTPSIRTPILTWGDNVFEAEASDDKGCRIIKDFTARGLYTPELEILVFPFSEKDSYDTICRGSSVLLVATGGSRYVWNVFQTTDSLLVTPREPFTYIVTAYGESPACYTTDSVTIHLKNCDMVYFPTAISLSSSNPVNRIFKPIGIPNDFNQYYLAIYNRWGQLIFESTNFDIGWNGTHQGENVRPGAYVFLFRSNNRGVIWEKVGTVTVVD